MTNCERLEGRKDVPTCQRAAVFCDPAGKRSPWGWLRHCPVTKNEQEIRPRGGCVLGGCGSLREVHLLLRGVLQTRHQVTVARYEIRDPLHLPVRLAGPPDSQILVHADSCQSDPMAPSLSPFLLMALATSYFNTRPPAVISRRPHPHSDLSSSFYLFYSIPLPSSFNPARQRPESIL